MERILIQPCITEKTMQLTPKGWYTFRVRQSASKQSVRHAIETQYSVTVLAVRTVSMHGKTHKVGRKGILRTGSDWKKAYVQLKKGQTIDAFQAGGSENP